MLIGSYSFTLVFISLCVAILASYTALDLTGRIATSKGRAVHLWTAGGAFAMGIGVWSMHFIGMLAFTLPIDLGYDITLTALSLLIAVLAGQPATTAGLATGVRRVDHGRGHQRDALHRHGRHAHAARHRLRPCIV
jgi:NO-binding membrane sensor protein with MHYT domain